MAAQRSAGTVKVKVEQHSEGSASDQESPGFGARSSWRRSNTAREAKCGEAREPTADLGHVPDKLTSWIEAVLASESTESHYLQIDIHCRVYSFGRLHGHLPKQLRQVWRLSSWETVLEMFPCLEQTWWSNGWAFQLEGPDTLLLKPSAIPSGGSAWHFQDGKSWIPFFLADSDQVERMWQKKLWREWRPWPTTEAPERKLQIGNTVYLLDFASMTQTNQATGRKRRIRRNLKSDLDHRLRIKTLVEE